MKKFITIILLVFVINLSLAHSKGVYQNYDEIEDIKNEKTTTPFGAIVKSFILNAKKVFTNFFLNEDTSQLINITNIKNQNYQEILASKGTIVHYVFTKDMKKEVNLGGKKFNLTLIEPVSWEGAIFEYDSKTLKLGTGATAYEHGFLFIKKGNRGVNGTIEALIDIIYVGEDDKNCQHIKCSQGNLHWYYCNGADLGIIEECDECNEAECMPKGYFSRVITQDPNIEKENAIKARIAKNEYVNCTYINGTGYGPECLD